MEHDERYKVRNVEIERALRTIAVMIDGKVPEGWGCGMFLVPFGKHEPEPQGRGAVFWISNSERAGMLETIKSWIDETERRAKSR